MFKFNFAAPADSDDEGVHGNAQALECDSEDKDKQEGKAENGDTLLAASEFKFDSIEDDLDEMAIEALFEPLQMVEGLVLLRCRPPESSTLGELGTVVEQSDLKPGVYEGGFKVWEGSIDLVQYLFKHQVPLQGKLVIELGCGHALPGIYAAQQGARVDLQDYNREVLETVTAQNVFVNCREAECKPRFFGGDWGTLSSVVGSSCYDVILTAETIYSEESVHRLIACMKQLLKPSGVAYIAAKSYYFGVGGSTRRFMDLVEKKLPSRSIERVELLQDGNSNVREILMLSAEKEV